MSETLACTVDNWKALQQHVVAELSLRELDMQVCVCVGGVHAHKLLILPILSNNAAVWGGGLGGGRRGEGGHGRSYAAPGDIGMAVYPEISAK